MIWGFQVCKSKLLHLYPAIACFFTFTGPWCFSTFDFSHQTYSVQSIGATGVIFAYYLESVPILIPYIAPHNITIPTLTMRKYDYSATLLADLKREGSNLHVFTRIPAIVGGTGPAFSLAVQERITLDETTISYIQDDATENSYTNIIAGQSNFNPETFDASKVSLVSVDTLAACQVNASSPITARIGIDCRKCFNSFKANPASIFFFRQPRSELASAALIQRDDLFCISNWVSVAVRISNLISIFTCSTYYPGRSLFTYIL
jgi:hypothetical protein